MHHVSDSADAFSENAMNIRYGEALLYSVCIVLSNYKILSARRCILFSLEMLVCGSIIWNFLKGFSWNLLATNLK